MSGGKESSWSGLFAKRFLLPRRLILSIIVSIACIAIGIFPITERFEQLVFEPPKLVLATDGCGGRPSYSFFLKDDAVIVRTTFGDGAPWTGDVEGIITENGIADLTTEAPEFRYCNGASLDLFIEGEDPEFRVSKVNLRREDTGLNDDELFNLALHGGAWRREFLAFFDQDTFQFELSDFPYNQRFRLAGPPEDDPCFRPNFNDIPEGKHDGNLVRVNGQEFCVPRTAIPHFQESMEDVEGWIESSLAGVAADLEDEDSEAEFVDWDALSEAERQDVVSDRVRRYYGSKTGIVSFDTVFQCDSCISPITRSFIFAVKAPGSRNIFENSTGISTYSDFEYIPESIVRIPDEDRVPGGELYSAEFDDDRFLVRYAHRDGFFNLDFYQILSSIFIGIGITILIEIAISANGKNSSGPQTQRPMRSGIGDHPSSQSPLDNMQVHFDLSSLPTAESQRVAAPPPIPPPALPTSPPLDQDVPFPSSNPVEPLSVEDQRYADAALKVLRNRKATGSWLQRQMGVGYNRAASWIERMEQEGLVSAPNHIGRRKILCDENGVLLETKEYESKRPSKAVSRALMAQRSLADKDVIERKYLHACHFVLEATSVDEDWLAAKMGIQTLDAYRMLLRMEGQGLVSDADERGQRIVLKKINEL